MQRAYLKVVLKTESKKTKVILGGLFALACLFVMFQYQRTVSFSYSGQDCFRDVTILPKVFKSTGDGAYGISNHNPININNYPLITTKSCVYALEAPKENASERASLAFLDIALPNKKFKIVTDDYPTLSTDSLGQKISVREPLKFSLDKEDKIFTYWISQGNAYKACQTNEQQVTCQVTSLNLKQNQQYSLVLERYFDNRLIEKITQVSVKTVEPIEVTKTSVGQNGIIYDKPTQIGLIVNKNLVSAKASLKLVNSAGKSTEVAHDLIIDKQQIFIKLKTQLERSASYELVLSDAVADDKGVLFAPYKVAFKTSGGPKVQAVSIGASSVDPNSSIVISFDQNLSTSQDVASLVSMVSANSPVAIKTSLSANKLVITPTTKLPICAKFTIKIMAGLTNQYGVGGGSAWSHNSRVRCYTTTTIGTSVQGRAITAWHFGSGPNKYIYFGSTHGNEKSTKYLLDRWIQELDSNFDRLPTSATVIVIPTINPDGFYVNSRRNANNVDLNRNFPANDWKKDVTMPGGELIINGGGATALSEPESQAIANFVIAQNPKLVLTYHSVAQIVSGNSVGSADSIAINYAETSGYSYSAFGEEDAIFHYDTTGAFETWTHDKIGIPTILIELGSHTYSEFNTNRSAMWGVLD